MSQQTNERKAAELTSKLVDLYMEALKQLKDQKACEACGQKAYNASLMREVREFLKQHDIELDARTGAAQDLGDAAGEVLPFTKRS